MTIIARQTRIAAGVVALTALAGLLIQFSASFATEGSAGAALWAMLRFFTIIGNALTMFVLAGVALGKPAALRPRLIGCVTLTMLLIGVVYVTMLRGTLVLSGAAAIADPILHYVMPVMTSLFWLFFAPKGGLHWGDPARWALLPLAYFPYGLARGAQDGKFPYPFINVDQLGWSPVLINAMLVALGFLIAGHALVWLDRRLAAR